MTNETGDQFMMIGLHKLAAERGDGLIPELLALYQARQTAQHSADAAMVPPAASTTPAGNDNVIALLPYIRARRGR